MSDTMTAIATDLLKGGEFVVRDTEAESVFIPEEINEDQQMVVDMCRDFLHNEVFANSAKIEKQQDGIAVELLHKMGALGLLGTHIPQEYGGLELDTNTNTFINDVLGPSGSFTVGFSAHMGIGMLPILYFGTEAQKQHYLPKLSTGELKAAYCLTEPSSGSDALAAKTRADLTEDGKSYLLNGQKMWISNAGWADVFIVFAKIGGEKFTGFIVDRDSQGLTFGAEEDKLGIKGSSTRQVFFENVKVPAENILGEIGKGHLIAFNALNIGRFKLGAHCVGGSKQSCTVGIRYANERYQFNQPISSFGAMQYKMAEQAIRIFTTDSSIYRVSNLMQERKEMAQAAGHSFGQAQLEAAEEYAIECSIIKVAGSEVLDYTVDETLQIHGGVGFSEEYTPARAYRDARINRIYEGTNEINRLLMVDQLLRRAMKGQLDLVGPAWAVQKELSSVPSFDRPTGVYAEEKQAVKDFKKIILMVAGAAVKMQMDGKLDLKKEQEILTNVANLLIDTFNAESTLLRVEKLADRSDRRHPQEVYEAILQTFLADASARMTKNATDALASFAEGDLLKTLLMGLKRYTKYPAINVKKTRQLIASRLIEANEYCF